MSNLPQIPPPYWPVKLLRYFLKQCYLEEIEGDMQERFQDNLEAFSVKKARRLYVLDTLKLMRAALMKRMSGDLKLNHYGMFRNYLKTSIRNIKRNTLFSGINIIGLAISMSVGVLMILFLSEIHSFDQFHDKGNKIYRVTSTNEFMDKEHNWATSSIFIADQVAEQGPGIENVAVMRFGLSAEVKAKSDFVDISGFYTTPSFFEVFSFKLLEGNPETALSEPNGVVLTESIAKKLFGSKEAVGKSLELESTGGWQNRTINGVVTGIIEDPPINSHIQFEALVSLKTYEQPASGSGWSSDFRTNPGDFQSNYVYLTLDSLGKKEEIESIMDKIITQSYPGVEPPVTHRLQPLRTCVTDDSYLNLPGPSFSRNKIYIMIGLTLIVILSACFNYTNLSMARSLRRVKEVGIRKVNGATGYQIFGQFVGEAVILSFCALAFGLILFLIIKPHFLDLPDVISRGRSMFHLGIGSTHIFWFLALALVIGLIAGCLPAFFLSRLRILRTLQQEGKGKLFSGINLRKGLTVLQFTLSMGLVMCSVLIYKQYQYAMNYELGYETENIVNIRIKGDYADLLENDYAAISEVLETSRSKRTLGYSTVFGTIESEDKSKTIRFLMNEVDNKYLDMHDFKLLAGSNFLKPLTKNGTPEHIIINEELLKSLDIASPEDAIGSHVWFNDQQLEIIGVVEDFLTTSLTWEVDKKFGFVQSSLHDDGILGVKLQGMDKLGALKKLERKFKERDPDHPFEADFYNDLLAISYREYKSMYTIISFLAFLAISISTLGLLAMVVFSVETRIREISIRKILGADVNDLLTLLSRGFLIMVVISALISIPTTVYIVDKWVLNEFTDKIEVGPIEMLSGFIMVFLIGMFTIGWQVRTVTAQNSTDVLRQD